MLKNKGRNEDIHVHNGTHKSRAKTYYLTESDESMRILNKYRKSKSST